MLQETVLRVSGACNTGKSRFSAPLIICNQRHGEEILEQLRSLDVTPHALVKEPMGRNTAPAAAMAGLVVEAAQPDGVLLILPADHHIRDLAAFHEAVARAGELANEGYLVTYGIVPDKPETGYGYIERGEAIGPGARSFHVSKFVEKPCQETAQDYLASGKYYWNSGIFTVRADVLLKEMERHCPDILESCRAAIARGTRTNETYDLDRESFDACRADSIDYAIMEHTENAAVVAVNMGWNDVGSWSAIHDIAEHDEAGNAVSGDVVLTDTTNSLVRAESRLVAVAGLDNVVVIETEDAVLVTTRDKAQQVKQIVESLKAAKRDEL